MRTTSPSEPVTNVPNHKEAEAAIQAIFDAGCAAWNRGKLDDYLASYWNSDKTIWVSGGMLTRGIQAITAAYKARFAASQQMGKLTVTDMVIEVLTDSNAIVFGRWTLAADSKTQKGVFTVQLMKIEGEWLFVSDHSSTSE
jgi:uncharacterized protein (TIGR02246 family)